MEPSILSVLPNLGVGVASIAGLVYVVMQFLAQLKDMRKDHYEVMREREASFRDLEREVRTQIVEQLTKNSQVMERVMNHLDRK